jgi:mono/diheme cytochrome c family protein
MHRVHGLVACSILGLGLLAGRPARADDDEAAPAATALPLGGDLANGATRYRLDCASCHGLTGAGDGPLAGALNPHPAKLRDGSYLWAHLDSQILDAMTGDGLAPGAPPRAHHLDQLDARDILAWLKQPVLEVSASFPTAVQYIAHVHKIDKDGQGRVEKVLDRPLTPAEAEVTIFTVYGPDAEAGLQPNGHPTKIADDPGPLYGAKPRRRLGYIFFKTLELSDGSVDTLLAMSNDSRLIDVRTMPSDDPKVEKSRAKLEKLLRSYIGSGGRVDKKPIEPHEKGVKAPKDVQNAMMLAFEQLLEGDAMFQKEERNRFALDPDAFNFPQAADQGEVKFKFKESKQK